MSRLESVLKNVDETKALLIEKGAINKVADLFKSQFYDAKAVIVTDQIIFDMVGEKIKNLLDEHGVPQEQPFVFEVPLLAAYENAELLTEALKKHDAIPIAVGSGIINDLVKLSSHQAGRRYMCVATAASVDGYTAYGSSLTLDGAKQTFSCPAPLACLADSEMISQAPLSMTAAGYADMFAKIPAGADWILADALGLDPINETTWSIVQGGLHEALSHPEGIVERVPETYGLLTERLMLSGLAMQHSKSTRPASGAEHYFSHVWDMEYHTYNGRKVAHGFQVSIGTLAVTALYEQLMKIPIEELDIEHCKNVWPTLDQFILSAVDMFKDTDYLHITATEIIAKYISKDKLGEQLEMLKSKWPAIKEKLSKQIVPFDEVKRCLKVVGAPVEPEEIGISREYLRETYYRASYLRRRFTVLDLVTRTDTMERCLDNIFGKNGIWEIA